MTDTELTDIQLHRAAAALHHALTEDIQPEQADRFLRRHLAFCAIEPGSPRQKEIRGTVADLVNGAAYVSEWAVELGALNLTPYHTHAWRTEDSFDLAVQLAAGDELKPAFRKELARAVHQAVEGVYGKFLGRVPHTHVPAAAQ